MTARVRSSDAEPAGVEPSSGNAAIDDRPNGQIVEGSLAAGAGLCPRGHRRGRVQHRCLPATELSASAAVRVPAGDVLSDLRLEGQSADSIGERLDAVGLLRRGSDDAAAAGTAGRRSRGGRRRLDAVHREDQTAVSAVPDDLQHRRRSGDDGGERCRVRVAWRSLRSCRRVAARQTTRWNDCDVLRRQYRACRGGDCPDVGTNVRASVVRRLPVERGQLHGGRDGRGCRSGRDRARGALESRADARTRVSHVQDVSGVRRPARGPGSSCARDTAAARGNRRGVVAGPPGGARVGGRKGSPGRHGRRIDAARRGTQPAARARARGQGERRRRQSPEGSVPRDRLPRVAHAAQRDPRLVRHVAAEHARRSQARQSLRCDFRERETADAVDRRAARRGGHRIRQASPRKESSSIWSRYCGAPWRSCSRPPMRRTSR